MIIGDGSTLAYATNLTTPVYTDIDEDLLISIELPPITTEDIEGPTLAGAFNKKRKSKPSGDDGTLTVEYNPDDAFVAQCLTWLAAGAPPTVRWKLTDELGGTLVWDGSIGGFTPPTFESGSRAEVEIPLAISSIYVMTPPA